MDQNHFRELAIEEYTEYVEYLRNDFQFSEEWQIGIDAFSDIVTSLQSVIRTLELGLKKEILRSRKRTLRVCQNSFFALHIWHRVVRAIGRNRVSIIIPNSQHFYIILTCYSGGN